MVSHKTLQDNVLFQLTKSGDQAAFKEIYERYFDVLFVHAYKRLQDKDEAQDVVQEIFTILWDKRLAITLTGTLPGYLYTAVRNKIINIISHKKVASSYIQSFQHFIGQDTCQTDYLARERQLIALIEKEVAALPTKMQEVFSLSRKNNLTHQEIATVLNLSEQTVKKQVHNALSILRIKFGSFLSFLVTCIFPGFLL